MFELLRQLQSPGMLIATFAHYDTLNQNFQRFLYIQYYSYHVKVVGVTLMKHDTWALCNRYRACTSGHRYDD